MKTEMTGADLKAYHAAFDATTGRAVYATPSGVLCYVGASPDGGRGWQGDRAGIARHPEDAVRWLRGEAIPLELGEL